MGWKAEESAYNYQQGHEVGENFSSLSGSDKARTTCIDWIPKTLSVEKRPERKTDHT
jgi:hypothetical protein